MKPPPRRRTTPNRQLPPQRSGSDRLACLWRRTEQRKLLNALRRLSRSGGDLDCAFLRTHVPGRSATEVLSAVESLKNKVISCASLKLKETRRRERRGRKPIEVWTNMASVVTGGLESNISTAFSQMLTVSSTEPRTLRHCDPPQVHRPPTDEDRPACRTVPLRPLPGLHVQETRAGTSTDQPLQGIRTPAAAEGPAVGGPNSQVPPPQQPSSTVTSHAATSTSPSAVTYCQLREAKILALPSPSSQAASQTVTPVTGQIQGESSCAAEVETQNANSTETQTAQPPSERNPTPFASAPTSSSSTSPTPNPHTTTSSVASSSSATSSDPTPPLSSPAAAFHAKFGRTSKFATEESPRMFGVKCVVDFERIYRYLSVIHKPNEDCQLTPMESAVVLDLLMSLPEELPLLDCNKLHKHLIQVYQCLSSRADSKIAREMLKDLRGGVSNRTDHQQRTAGTSRGGDVTGSEGSKPQPDETQSQSSANSNTHTPSMDSEVPGLCPPLNPFMIPLKLLTRRKGRDSDS